MRLKKVERHIVLIVFAIVLALCCISSTVYYATYNYSVSQYVEKYGNGLHYKLEQVLKNLKNIILDGNIADEDLAIQLDEKLFILEEELTIESSGDVVIIEMKDEKLADNEILVKQYGVRCFYQYEEITNDIYMPHDVALSEGKLKIVKGKMLEITEQINAIAQHSRLLKIFSGQVINSGYLAQTLPDYPILVIYSSASVGTI